MLPLKTLNIVQSGERESLYNGDVNNQWISFVYDANAVMLASVSSVDSRQNTMIAALR